MNTERMYEHRGEMLTRAQMYEKAFNILDDMDRILEESLASCTKKIKELKAAAPGTLSDADQALLDAQLAHEAKYGIVV